jgi:hypothetical protein
MRNDPYFCALSASASRYDALFEKEIDRHSLPLFYPDHPVIPSKKIALISIVQPEKPSPPHPQKPINQPVDQANRKKK